MADHKNGREGMKQEQSNRERTREERKYFLNTERKEKKEDRK